MSEGSSFYPGTVTLAYVFLGPLFGFSVIELFVILSIIIQHDGKSLNDIFHSAALLSGMSYVFGLIPAFIVGFIVDIFRARILRSLLAALLAPIVLNVFCFSLLFAMPEPGAFALWAAPLPLGLPASILVWSVLYIPIISRSKKKRKASEPA